MATPTKKVIEKYRKQVDRLKAKFEKSIKIAFHKWQVKVFAEFKGQISRGASILIVSPELKKALHTLLLDHYHEVAEAFAPGISFDQVKQSATGDPVGSQEEDEDNNFIDWMLPGIFAEIVKGINAQIDINLPIHERSIINTTQQIGTQSVSIARADGGNVNVIMANRLAGRETTVSITETDWIAESSMNTALAVTTPSIAIADRGQLKEIQKVSPNVTLKELNVDKAYATPIFLAATKRQLAIPQKMWVTMGDKRVRKTHQGINGVQVQSTEPFILPGGLLMFPGDSSLGVSFSEVVNCRCYALYF